jgi:hypothetical protein
MYEVAQEIFDYLPINKSLPEARYIEHLWRSFLTLDDTDGNDNYAARPFIIMPFHLIFMLALQYKVLRIYREKKREYGLAFTIINPRDDQKAVLSPGSAFDLALISESQIIDLLKIVAVPSERIREIKSLVRNRNDNLAHAKGGIEIYPNNKVDQYLDALRNLQPFFVSHNDLIADQWINNITEEDDINEYVDSHLIDTLLCPADFRVGLLSVFNLIDYNEDIPYKKWQSAIKKVAKMGNKSSLLWLKHLAQNHPDNKMRSEVLHIINNIQNLM